jgi:hypothetical protein
MAATEKMDELAKEFLNFGQKITELMKKLNLKQIRY